MRASRASLCLCVLLAAVASPGGARAQTSRSSPEVTASLDPCVPVDAGQFHRILAIELGRDVRYLGEAESAEGATRISLTCSDDGIVLKLRDGVTRKDMERVLRTEPLRQASGSRLLALAVAEFVVASWIELDVQPEPAVEPVGPAPAPTLRTRATSTVRQRVPALGMKPREPRLELGAGVVGQVWSSHDGILIGGQLRLLHRVLDRMAWTVSGDFGWARLDARQGELEVTTTSGSAAVLLYLPLGPVDLHAGGGGRIGFARMEGLVEGPGGLSGESFFAPFGGPMLYVRNGLELSRGLRMALELEAGLATLEAEALDEARQLLLAFEGVWIGAALSLSAVF